MPIHEADPWRLQYFAGIETSADITTEDTDAWQWYPEHRWVYDKLKVALSQNLAAAPHGVAPPGFPVFSKPIVNLKGMGAGSRLLCSAEDYAAHNTPGHFWMTLLEGRHVSSDVAVVGGVAKWWRHVTGKPAGEGTFDYWTIQRDGDPEIEARCGAWIARYLRTYTGMLNVETIGGTIIEVHLRFADQWPDLYGDGWVKAVVELYESARWEFADRDRRDGFSVVLFAPNGRWYRHPPPNLVEAVKAIDGVSSVQITFHENIAPQQHAMPPGGFRVAVINGFDLDAARGAREKLRGFFLA
jgi:hypothetical protein